MPSDTPTIDRPTVAIETHGCKLNQADSSLLARRFVEAGYLVVGADQPADVFVVNTCTVTHVADRKARQALRSARRRNPDATIVAAGCYSQRSPEDLRQLEEVDLVVGNAEKPTLVRQVMDWRGEQPVPYSEGTDELAHESRTARTRGMVKIQEGCDQVCAYCIVPRVRGRERSIPASVIIGEIGRLVSHGYQEVVLTGTQLGSYGFDLPDMSLTRLLDRVLSETDVRRLRVSSLQPQEIDLELLDLWSDSRVCPHFHLALQSGSDAVLKRMRRRYTGEQYVRSVEMIRDTICNVSITADVIVGFPGETQEDFEKTRALCDRVGFSGMHVFPYSVRPGTSAAHFASQVGPEIKARRTQALLRLAQSHATSFRMRSLGAVRPVLWEETTKVNGLPLWSGLTDNYIRVLGSSARQLGNHITQARISSVSKDMVYAQVL